MRDCLRSASASFGQFDLPGNSVFDIRPTTLKLNFMQWRDNANVYDRKGGRTYMRNKSWIILSIRSSEHRRQRPANNKSRLSRGTVIQKTWLWKVSCPHTIRIATKVSNQISRVELLLHDRRTGNVSSREPNLENQFHKHIWRRHIKNRCNR